MTDVMAFRIVAAPVPRLEVREVFLESRASFQNGGSESWREVSMETPYVSESDFRDRLAVLLERQDHEVTVEARVPGTRYRADIVARPRAGGPTLVIETKIADHIAGVGQVWRYADKLADALPVLAMAGEIPSDLIAVCRHARVRPWDFADLAIVAVEPVPLRLIR